MSTFDRRSFLRGGLLIAAGAAVSACSGKTAADTTGNAPAFIGPSAEQVRAAEAARHPAAVRDFVLTPQRGTVDLGGKVVDTWSYDGRIPGAQIRVKAGEAVRARVVNRLPADTSVHWHGLALRNDADGVPGVTQPPIRPGTEFTYEFTTPTPGTYWFHPHAGPQLDRGLYAPLIVEDPHEPLSYDEEWVVVFDDWLDGVTGTPDQVLAELRKGMMGGMNHSTGDQGEMDGMDMSTPSPGGGSHMLMGATSDLLGGDAGDVAYPYFLLNGRLPTAPETFRAKPGTRVRIRFINAGGDTAVRVALGEHKMTVTHTDGFPIEPASADALLIGMGERYDVLVTLKDGVFPLVALAEGKNGAARALVRTSVTGRAPSMNAQPAQLKGKIVRYDGLRPAQDVRLPSKASNRTIRLELTGSMMAYNWAINGKPYDPKTIHAVRTGERVRLSFVNRTTMWHPMHLHGHTFALADSGIRKDTAIVLPNTTLDVDFDADNPGMWMIHCHNIYHAEVGMMTTLGYLRA
ncbi:multicopper oxidase family protein [Thermostaphylospora chromogena]|uniref:Multicopper oxidase with three cupredoxin domains (Includes cell division protein FtsP and spore coat protein CotA) n=1 Tax=Thermostaphylospora chromogena TaxID=35622 RepID=A0A1H1C338_9ACTN|nr:multicopper oxidase family protein [Thermostaphylospora chromogena]SDQ58076.1 Multicopper oxidase with three cupredoxin domains (includes cell division protein FtsP and spore coat protein CotA) [Thermostaphylospora chromogena]